MASTTLSSEDAFAILEDIKRVYNIAGRISKRLYIEEGKYSDRQVKKHFGGSFGQAFEKAGLVGRVPTVTGTKEHTPTAAQVTKNKPDETQAFKDGEWTVTKVSRIHSIEGLIEHFKVDLEVWEVVSWDANKWEMGFTTENSKGKKIGDQIPLYQVKAKFKKRVENAFAKLELESLKQRFLEEGRTYRSYTPEVSFHHRHIRTLTGNMLEINVPDLHAGKLAWAKETGYKDYDTNIALDTFDAAVDTLLARSSHIQFDKILFIVGNDMMHSDTIAGTTTSGTQLDNDSRYHKTFVKLRNRLIDTIKFKLLPIAPVHVIGCPGNHDKLSAWHLADSLEMYFHGNSDISIDNSPEEFKFFQWGQVMLMFAHGNTGKKPDYPLTMATKRKEMWAATSFREAHTGHVHQTMVQEFHGVRVRVFPALCEPDAWHAANNYVGNLKVAEGYAWNADEGLINKAFYNAL